MVGVFVFFLQEKLEALQKSGGSKEDQERLIEEYERDLSKMKNKMDADRVRMQSDLQVRNKNGWWDWSSRKERWT